TVTDHGDGSYTATYTPLETGPDQLAITLGGVAIGGSPYSSNVVAGPPSAAQTTATVPPGTAGAVTTITVQARDSLGNNRTSSSGPLGIVVSGANAGAVVAIADNGNGTYTVGYTPTVAGADNIAITLGGLAIGGSPYSSQVSPGQAAGLVVTGMPATVTAGVPASITVTANDLYGNAATGFVGTVGFTSTDGAATLPANYTFQAGDAGTHTFTGGVTLRTAGTRSVTATAGALVGSQSVAVDPAAAATLTAGGLPDPFTAGTSASLVVTAFDPFGNVATGYTGTVTFAATDPAATLPAGFTFQAGDAGSHTFVGGVTLRTIGSRSVTVTDATVGTLSGSQTVSVIAGSISATNSTVVANPGTIVAGTGSSTITVTARDASNNPVAGAPVVLLASGAGNTLSQPAATDPTGVTTGTLSSITSGLKTVSATIDGTPITQTATVDVTPGSATTLAVSGIPNPAGAGVPVNVTVVARDTHGNVDIGYAGTITFTSTDGGATLPAPFTFQPADAGTHTFAGGVTLVTAGSQTVTVSDGSLVGGQTVTVQPATAPASFLVSGIPDPIAAGSAADVTVTVRDAFGNVVTGYTGSITFSSTDGTATLPGAYTFQPADAGTHTFTGAVILRTAGGQGVSASDGTISGSQTVTV
ncbi:MAG: Ig-like domain-containing protein, partial [Sporichthyaceae bacterium]|nr:Ig-like domain-containing protein [Sporichthyaceae bacterium]